MFSSSGTTTSLDEEEDDETVFSNEGFPLFSIQYKKRDTNYKFIYIDDGTTSTNIDSPIESVNPLFIDHDDLNCTIINTEVDNAVSKRLQFQRQNSISSRFRQQSKDIG